MIEKQEFCWNSRRWVLLMMVGRGIPSTCPHACPQNGRTCIGPSCGYHEDRPESRYFAERWGFLKTLEDDDGH